MKQSAGNSLKFVLLLLLALQRDNGNFLLNGRMVIGLGVREFRAAGAKIWYSGSEKPIEQIKIDGKTTEPIKVHVSVRSKRLACFTSLPPQSLNRVRPWFVI